MSHKDRLIRDRNQLDLIIRQAEICHLACCLDGQPYVIPLAYGYDGQSILIHTGCAGKKINIFTQNPRVCLSFENNIQLVKDPNQACEWSFEYTSVIAEGEIQEIFSAEEKASALNLIMLHYSGRNWDFPSLKIKSTRVWKIQLYNITGKQSLSD